MGHAQRGSHGSSSLTSVGKVQIIDHESRVEYCMQKATWINMLTPDHQITGHYYLTIEQEWLLQPSQPVPQKSHEYHSLST